MLLNELISIKVNVPSALEHFLPLAMEELALDKLPRIKLVKNIKTKDQSSFGRFDPATCCIELGVANRHLIDILRTLAHELVHFRQNQEGKIKYDSGDTGSNEENQANSVAGVIMRKFNKKYPQYFDTSVLIMEARGLFARQEGEEFKDNTTGEIFKFKGIERYPSTGSSYRSASERDLEADKVISELNPIEVNSRSNTLLSFAVASFESENGAVRNYLKYFTDVSGNMYGKWMPKSMPGLSALSSAVAKSQAGLKPQEILSKSKDIKTDKDLEKSKKTQTNAKKVEGHKFANEQALTGTLMSISDSDLAPEIKKTLANFNALPIEFNLKSKTPPEAVSDNLGEIVQALAFTRGLIDEGDANRARKAVFGRNTSWNQLGIEFPGDKTAGLIDFNLYKNNKKLGVSSKSGKGAPASVSNIWNSYQDMPADEKIKFKNKYEGPVNILEIILTGKMPGASEADKTISSVEAPLLLGIMKNILTEEQADEVRKLYQSAKKSNKNLKMSKWARKTAEEIKAVGTNWFWGYRLLAAVAKKVAKELNKDDTLSEAMIELLNKSSILQVHSKISKKENLVRFTEFEVKYPAVFEGKLEINHDKTYFATSPATGRYTFKFK